MLLSASVECYCLPLVGGDTCYCLVYCVYDELYCVSNVDSLIAVLVAVCVHSVVYGAL